MTPNAWIGFPLRAIDQGSVLSQSVSVAEQSTENVPSQSPASSSEIQEVSWNPWDFSKSTTTSEVSSLATTQRTSDVVRDNAPPTYVVIACLVGFGILSLILGLASLPHHWFGGDTTTWRERKRW